jgi:MFS family permease
VLGDIVGRHWAKIVLCILVISGATITQYFFAYTTTYAITELHYSQRVAMAANLIAGVVGTVFSVVGGLLADRFNLKLIAMAPRLVVAILLYPALHMIVASGSPAVFLATIGGLMAMHAMAGAAGIVLIPKLFPQAIRTSGLSIAYALGVTIFGGTAQVIFTAIIGATGDKLSWVWYIVAMGVISFLATAAIRVPSGWTSAPAQGGTAAALAATSD